MKKILIAFVLFGLTATHVQANGGGGWHGHGYRGAGPWIFFGALAALSIPLYYSRAWAERGPYYTYGPYYAYPGPTVYATTPVYVQNPPDYVQRRPAYAIAAAQPGNAVSQPSSNGVIELGPVGAQPSSGTGADPSQNSSAGQPAGPWFVYPSRGQNAQQVANDRNDCNRWAVTESGYDPELRTHRNPQTGYVAYGRALSACLEGRGYAVR